MAMIGMIRSIGLPFARARRCSARAMAGVALDRSRRLVQSRICCRARRCVACVRSHKRRASPWDSGSARRRAGPRGPHHASRAHVGPRAPCSEQSTIAAKYAQQRIVANRPSVIQRGGATWLLVSLRDDAARCSAGHKRCAPALSLHRMPAVERPHSASRTYRPCDTAAARGECWGSVAQGRRRRPGRH
jgi:hypothetical protein